MVVRRVASMTLSSPTALRRSLECCDSTGRKKEIKRKKKKSDLCDGRCSTGIPLAEGGEKKEKKKKRKKKKSDLCDGRPSTEIPLAEGALKRKIFFFKKV